MIWRTNHGMQVLINQIKAANPGCVIGTVGDTSHSSSSDHYPHKLNGDNVVNALDPMVSSKLTSGEIDRIVAALVKSRDSRIKYIIWQRRIISGNSGTKPWVWRTYTGTSDPHTNHAHISVTNGADTNKKNWSITVAEKPYPKWVDLNDYKLPILSQGMNDDDFAGYNNVTRLQDLVGAETDGAYGPGTAAKVKDRLGYGDGKTVGANEWATILGLSKQ